MAKSLKSLALPVFIIILFIVPIFSSFYKYYFLKDYNFIVEAPCDESKETCFTRDCSIADECPPNEISIYKEWYIKAYDFSKCADNTCAKECENGIIKCKAIECDIDAGDNCTINN
jgi:hypothetical protein